ncbi:MAG: glycine cleavage system protein T [Alphaproteobacteria bacterium]|nr:glycine cleavage system protein T [Alphaproteobacteria bacterium]
MFTLSHGTRVRKSPFYDATVDAGVSAFTVYNHMMMPTGYRDPVSEYWRLIHGVSLWDVAVERQVEVVGPDAAELAQALTPRSLSTLQVGRGRYAPICDHDGILLNDPIILKLNEDQFWFSIADSDLMLWARAVAQERRLRVTVFEPDVGPLAVQGPKSTDVVADVFGDWVRDLPLFGFRQIVHQDMPLVVARSGWSKQGGFEIYLRDRQYGTDLWNLLMEAGFAYEIGPGYPNTMERIEGGLLSFGSDTDAETNPYEVRLGRYVNLDTAPTAIGIEALRKIHAEGPKRHQLGVLFDEGAPLSRVDVWMGAQKDGVDIGSVTSSVFSIRLERTIGLALVDRLAAQPGDRITVDTADGEREAELVDLPFDVDTNLQRPAGPKVAPPEPAPPAG